MLRRLPLAGGRSRLFWAIYNLFYGRLELREHQREDVVAAPSAAPRHVPRPPLMPQRADWRELILRNSDVPVPASDAAPV
jgi:hypothetical protein